MTSARYALHLDAADQNLIELVVKSLGRGPFRSKVNCDPGAVASDPSCFTFGDGNDGAAANVQRDHAAGTSRSRLPASNLLPLLPLLPQSHKISDNAQEFLAPSA
jgi:hypothetical protein